MLKMDSNDIAGALGKLLEDPAALQKAMSIASGLMGGMQAENVQSTPQSTPATASAPEARPVSSSATESTANSSGEMPNLAALAPLLSGVSKNDPRCTLLYALKPYMGHGRAEKIDTLVNLLRIADLAGGMLGGKLF